MKDKEIYIFLGPPFSGKETQTKPLSQELNIPVFSMGELIREARTKNPEVEQAFQQYAAKGFNLPIEAKFELLRKKMDQTENGFILDNFPATEADLGALNGYLSEHELSVKKAFLLNIGFDEIISRFENNPNRGRVDDTPETLLTRSRVQSEDRRPVIEYFRSQGKLIEIDGEQPIEEVSKAIHNSIS